MRERCRRWRCTTAGASAVWRATRRAATGPAPPRPPPPHDLALKPLRADSAVRGLQAGAGFPLTDHSRHDVRAAADGDSRFTVLAIWHEAANNIGAQATRLFDNTTLESGSYRNRFVAVPEAARLVPPAAI